jgi:heme-degrading monooxygenase HmoA
MTEFSAGQIVTVFRSRLRSDAGPGYGDTAEAMVRLARSMPGLVDVKSFAADDGERVTIATFADDEAVRAWREHPEHRVAQQRGYDHWYAEFSLQVCETVRLTTYPD